mgnify:FL=1
MVSEKIVVGSALGIHLRPAGAMCDAAVKYDSHITFAYGEGKTANAKSVISILAAGIKCGDEIELIADGPDEQEALENVAAAFKESPFDDNCDNPTLTSADPLAKFLKPFSSSFAPLAPD